MRDKFREDLFNHSRKTVMALGGTQKQRAEALGISQGDISILKRGAIEMFSTDKLLDLAYRCGKSFEYTLVSADMSLVRSAAEKTKNDLNNMLSNMNRIWGEE